MHYVKRSIAFLMCALFFLGLPLAAPAQEVLKQIDLNDGMGPPDYAFGMKLSPDGTYLYVAVCGDFFGYNNRLVKIDTLSDSIVGEGVTGLYPEEIEFRLDGSGAIELIFVSNNQDHTVTVLDPDLTTVTTTWRKTRSLEFVDSKVYGGWAIGCPSECAFSSGL